MSASTRTATVAKPEFGKRVRDFERSTALPLLGLSLAIIPLLLLPLVANLSESTENRLGIALWVILTIFALELAIRTYLAERRPLYLASNWFDVALVVTTPVLMVGLSAAASANFLRPLRVARPARALRVVRLSRAFSLLPAAWKSTRAVLKRRGLQYVLLAGFTTILGFAALMMAIEHGEGSIDDYGTALWWSISTFTTVGYGDVVPQSPAGRVVAVLLMVVGIAFLSWVTATTAAFLVEYAEGEDNINDKKLMAKLHSIEQELQELKNELRAARADAPRVTETLE